MGGDVGKCGERCQVSVEECEEVLREMWVSVGKSMEGSVR